MVCTKCGAEIKLGWDFCQGCGTQIPPETFQQFSQKREYKIVVKRGKTFSLLKPTDIEQTLNEISMEGWIFDNYMPGELFSEKNSIVLIFHREL